MTRNDRIPELRKPPHVRPSGKTHDFATLVTDRAGAAATDVAFRHVAIRRTGSQDVARHRAHRDSADRTPVC